MMLKPYAAEWCWTLDDTKLAQLTMALWQTQTEDDQKQESAAKYNEQRIMSIRQQNGQETFCRALSPASPSEGIGFASPENIVGSVDGSLWRATVLGEPIHRV
jgi:hypothetical protein